MKKTIKFKNLIKYKKYIYFLCSLFLLVNNLQSQSCVSNCSLYVISSIASDPVNNIGTNLTLGDDQVSGSVPLGFTFSFMCNSYTSCIVSSNGFLSFNPNCGNGCCTGMYCPTPNGNPNNYVAFARNITNWTTTGDAYRWSPQYFPSNLGNIAGDTSVCSGSSTSYSIPALVGVNSYSWTLPSGWSGSFLNNNITGKSNGSSGTISVTASSS